MNLILEAMIVVAITAQQESAVDQNDLICMSRAIYHEARGEDVNGQIAVAQVIANRVESGRYPDSVCGVVREDRGSGKYDCQFSYYCDGLSDVPNDFEAYAGAMFLGVMVLEGRVENPVPGATHFYAPAKSNPSWASAITEIAVIGNHRFMEE